MMHRVEGALVEAHELESELVIKPSHDYDLIGSSLLREATIKPGMLAGAKNQYRHHLLRLDMEASGCELVILLSDPATLDTSHLCIWRDDDAEARPSDAISDADTPMPNGEDAFARLRASRPAEQWLARDDAEAAFAAKYYDGSASDGFYPTHWQWLTAQPPHRRLVRAANATTGVGGGASSSDGGISSSGSSGSGSSGSGSSGSGGSGSGSGSSSGSSSRGMDGSVLVLDGLAASKTYAVFRSGTLGRGKRLFDDILAQQSRMIPGAVAAASLHDPVLNKLLWLVLWRSERARNEGERMLAGVLNVSSALAPMLAEPLGNEGPPRGSV